MNDILFWLAVINVVLCVVIAWQLTMGGRQLQNLRNIEPLQGDLPRVSVIVAARNEARDIEPALASLLALDYPNLQLIVVNDRSTDATGRILDRLSEQNPRLAVVHLSELPAGWLGKNHALFCGAQQADGEWLLFTDADVVMHSSTLRRAMKYAIENKIDHLPMLFRIQMPTWFLEAFVIAFFVFFLTYFRPWKVRDPRSKAHIGVGGFNLLRKTTYHAVGTFQTIAMRPDDDLKLGKIVKQAGFRQDVLIANDFVQVPWYASVSELIHGLEKNAFAGVDYRPWVVVLSSATALIFNVFPFMAVCFTNGNTQIVYAVAVIMLWGIAIQSAIAGKLRWWPGLFFPIAVLLFVYIQWRTMILNLWHDGIRWRDTHYSLAELKANRV